MTNLRAALEPFAAYAGPKKKMPDDFVITQGSGFARRQLTMGDCYRAAEALAAAPPADVRETTHVAPSTKSDGPGVGQSEENCPFRGESLQQEVDTPSTIGTAGDRTAKNRDAGNVVNPPDLSSRESLHRSPGPSDPTPAREPSQEWKLIETAPKDMTEIIVLCGQKDVRLGWYFAPSSITFGWKDQRQKSINPTHWMPFPVLRREPGGR